MQPNYSDRYALFQNIEILNLFVLELSLINTKAMIKNNLKELLKELEKFKVQTLLPLEYKKRIYRIIFHLSTKLIFSDSDIDDSFEPMHQNMMIKIKNYSGEDWVVLDVIIKHNIKILSVHK